MGWNGGRLLGWFSELISTSWYCSIVRLSKIVFLLRPNLNLAKLGPWNIIQSHNHHIKKLANLRQNLLIPFIKVESRLKLLPTIVV